MSNAIAVTEASAGSRRVRRFRADALWSASGTLVPAVLAVATIPPLAAKLGAGEFTLFALGAAILSLAPNLDFGMSRTTFRHIAAAAEPEAVRRIAVAAMQRSVRVSLLIVAVMMVGLLVFYVAKPGAMATAAPYALAVAMLGVPAAILANVQRSILEGAGRFSASAAMRIGLGAATSIIPLLLALLVPQAIWLIAMLVILRIIMLVQQHKTLVDLDLVPESVRSWLGAAATRDRLDPIFLRESWWYAATAPVVMLMSGFDKFIVIGLSGFSLAQLAVFVAPQEIALKAIILPASLIPALFVRIADTTMAADAGRRGATRLFYPLTGVILAGCLGVTVASHPLAAKLFPALAQFEVTRIIIVLAFGVFANAVAQFPMTALTARGLVSRPAFLQLCELPFVVIALAVMLPRIGIVAAALVWSGRIVIDSMLLLIMADRAVPDHSIRGWKLSYLIGIVLLTVAAYLFHD